MYFFLFTFVLLLYIAVCKLYYYLYISIILEIRLYCPTKKPNFNQTVGRQSLGI